MIPFWNNPKLKQYLVILTANLNMLCFGASIAWNSPMLVKLKEGDNTGLPPVTDEEGSWIISIGILTSLPFQFAVGPLMDKTGRKTCLAVGSIPRVAASFLQLFAPKLWMLLTARVINDLINVGMVVTMTTTYASEIASKEIRGALGTTAQVASATGMLIFFGVGPYLPYFYVNLLYTCIVTAVSIPMWFLPESPYYLYSRGRKEESIEVLINLRGSTTLANEEIKEYDLCLNESATKPSIKEIFKDSITRKSFCKVIIFTLLIEAAGYNALTFYMMEILKSTKTTVSNNIASVANGCIQLIACLCTILLTDKFGRRPLLITTLLGMSTGMVGLGTFFYLKQQADEITGLLNYLPILSIMLVMFCFNAGLGAICWTVIAEMFNGPARAMGVSSCISLATIIVFLGTKYFTTIINTIGPANLYWWLGFNCVLAGLYIFFLIPETKGKSFSQIQIELGRKIESKGSI